MFSQATLIIGGETRIKGSEGVLELTDPATDEVLAALPKAGLAEVKEATEASLQGFIEWSAVSPYDRSKVLRRAAHLMRARTEEVVRCLTLEQGKPLAQSRLEWAGSADLLDWFAEEGRRSYGRIIAGRIAEADLRVQRKPVGPVAALAPWNFPAWGMMQKIAPALAAGCSVVAKPSEVTPVTAWHIAMCLLDAGLPPRAISVLWGSSSTISEALIKSSEIRKVSLTGSTRVGRIVAAMAGEHLKKVTMELGGHAPVIIAADADMSKLVPLAAQWKFRNAGQVCVSPTRFLVEDAVYDEFVDGLGAAAAKITVGHGLEEETLMGPLCTRNQRNVISAMVADARAKGARVVAGGDAIGNTGNFHSPTVVAEANSNLLAMNDEPFGPLALVARMSSIDEALAEANRMPVGLASFAFTSNMHTAAKISRTARAGMLGINHFSLGLPETPFGGILDSGFGSEGGIEGLEAYTSPFLVSSLA
ncbi:MAG: NAD-dependent succinate-semialdehyde dehydrogenase [Gammaproteobacteria bacterium]|nr:NAD-dependent succinate-semialdehyde dehydrogenase [Rhizobiaceae bacterium]MBU4115401.1 NAD-dependent succinate-semialdehyde dehydrogenase [Gammaproteobacteria bacterium]